MPESVAPAPHGVVGQERTVMVTTRGDVHGIGEPSHGDRRESMSAPNVVAELPFGGSTPALGGSVPE
jgi:hypothetical protein